MSTVLTTNTPGAATDASVQAITTKLGTTLLVDNSAHTQPVSGSVTANLGTLNGAATDASVQAVTTKLGTTLLVDASAHIQPVSGTVTANLGTIAGVMTDVTGQSILTAIQNQRAVIPYTDDTNAFYLLQIKNGTATWTDAANNAISAPSTTGLRPADGVNVISYGTPLQASSGGTGYVSGDLLYHVLTYDPSSGAKIGEFWENMSQGTKLSAAPTAGTYSALAPLPTHAATDTLQSAGNASVASIDGKTPVLVGGAVPVVFPSIPTINTRQAPFVLYEANTTGTGFVSNDQIAKVFVIDESSGVANIATAYLNVTQSTLLTTTPANSALTPWDQIIPASVATSITATATWQTSLLNAATLTNSYLSEVKATGSLGASGLTLALANGPNGTVGFKVSGTFVGTLSVFGTIDGTTYDVPLMIRALSALNTSFVPTTGLASTGTNMTGAYYVEGEGLQGVEIVMSSWTSGSAAIVMLATNTVRSMHIKSSAADPAFVAGSFGGNPLSGTNGWPVSGVYNASSPTLTNASTSVLQLDASGNLKVTGSFGTTGTYNTVAPTLTNGQTSPLQMDASGNLKVAGSFASTGVYNTTPPTLTNGQSTPLQTDAGGNLKVAGSFSATFQGKSANPAATPTITSGSAYTAGYLVGGVLTFSAAAAAGIGSGILQNIRISSKSIQTAGFKLYVFNANPSNTTWTDKAVPAINAADIPALIGVYSLSSADSGLGPHTLYTSDNIGKDFVIPAAGTTLYGILVTTGTPNFTSTSDLSVYLSILQD